MICLNVNETAYICFQLAAVHFSIIKSLSRLHLVRNNSEVVPSGVNWVHYHLVKRSDICILEQIFYIKTCFCKVKDRALSLLL